MGALVSLSRWTCRCGRSRLARYVIAGPVCTIALVPQPSHAAACDEWLHQKVRATGAYVATGQAYSRTFVFAMLFECKGTKEVVTVQRATGNLPVCEARQQVEVVGTLIWNKALVDGHYEINDPSSVTCLAAAPPLTGPPQTREATLTGQTPPSRAQTAPPHVAQTTPAAEPSRAQPKPVGSSVWVGRYQDNRGAGDATFTLLRGGSTVSGSWRSRMGGGGPITGFLDPDGSRMLLRMDNIAPECPGTFEGDGDMTDTTLVATYRGKDCEGAVTGGRLELRRR